jgi:iron complex transport system substrate-binding protein
MRNIRFAVLAVFALTLGCQPAGCTRPAPPPDGPTVTDDLGRSVTVAKTPERVVSLTPAATEMLYAIGAGPKVVAGTEFDNYPEEAKRLPRIGGFTPQSINVEAILVNRPDLIVAGPQKDVIAALEKYGIPVVALDPKGVNAVWDDIELLGKLTGCEAKAKEVADGCRAGWSLPTSRYGNSPIATRPRVLFVLADEPLITCGRGTFLDEIITAAGGENAFGDVGGEWPRVSDEQVLARKPDVILYVDHAGQGDAGVPARLRGRGGWKDVPAVKAGKVFAVDADLLTRPGPRLVEGLEQVQKRLRD